MHADNMNEWRHSHHFHGDTEKAEAGTRRVVWLTVIMMVVEIAAGYAFGSMALLADGWHMGTHATALGISLFAYAYARRHAHNEEFSFGTGKVGILGGYTSAIILGVVALLMLLESAERLISPQTIQFDQALVVAVVGLIVNLASAFMLTGHHNHDHHGHGHGHGHHHDHNLRAAYLHVVADALTSVLAIVALFAGKAYGLTWMDPLMGIVGAVIIARWAYGLVRDTAGILLDRKADATLREAITKAIEDGSDARIADLHVWHLNSTDMAAIISVVTHGAENSDHYKARLKGLKGLAHVTVEVQICDHD